MNKIVNTVFHPGNYNKKLDTVFFLLRVAVGALMLTHGTGKFSTLYGDDPVQFADPIGLGASASLTLAVFAEVVCSLLLLLGLATRFAAFSLLITMLVAALIVHANDPFSKQELPLLYIAIYVVIITVGPGKISIDNWIYSKFKR